MSSRERACVDSTRFKLFESQRLLRASRVRSINSPPPVFAISLGNMAEFITPPRMRGKRVMDKAELNTPIKIPASPFLQQIGYGTGTYLVKMPFLYLPLIFILNYKQRMF